MSIAGLFSIVLADERHRSDMVSLMIPALVPGIRPEARMAVAGMTAQTAVVNAEQRAVVVATQALEAASELSTEPGKPLSDEVLAGRPALAIAVRAVPDLKNRVEAAATTVTDNRTQLLNQAVVALGTALKDPLTEAKFGELPEAIRDAVNARPDLKPKIVKSPE